ncbi:transcription repressor OFP13-like [Lolium rigidum]|uniref:transcription repressor OFP13-like n=1 Tax=Lolium rigidum TaxID=89674 RepID=UPI001F5CCA49|nr:transcription repressor OFP13-like [Lolium rigidum]
MVRKQPLSFLFYAVNPANQDATPPSSPPTPTATPQAWMWPSCKHPTTSSFRSPSASASAAAKNAAAASLFLDSAESSSFTNSSARMHHDCAASDSLSTESEPSAAAAEDTADAIVRGLRSDRLRFEPRARSSSILEKKPGPERGRGHAAAGPFGGGVPLALDSADPYVDFRASMEEMMASRGMGCAGDWDWLERMLGWYLRANGKDTHAAIVAAFVDLVVTTTAAGCASGNSSFTLAGSDRESGSAGGNGSFRRLRRTKSSVSG